MTRPITTLAPALDRFAPSPTLAMTQRVGELRRAGVDVIGLSAGEPDFPTEPHVIDAAFRAMQAGETRYTDVDGTPALKQAVADKFRRDNGLTYALSEISVGAGGKQVLFNALVATLHPNNEVLIPAPYWVSYPDIVRYADGVPVILPTNSGQGYRITPEQLAAAITPKTRWLILNNPGNPSGAGYDADQLRALGDVLLAHPHVMLLSDDMYEHIWFRAEPYATMVEVVPELKDRVLTLNGVSKAHAMTGWRIGFAGGPEWIVKAMAKLQSQSSGNPCSVAQAAAVAALNGPQDHLAEHNAKFKERRDLIVAMLNDTPGLTCPVPDGAFYVFPDATGLIGAKKPDGGVIADDWALCDYLLERGRVAAVAGSAFGHAGAFRISYAVSRDVLREAARRIQDAVADLEF